MPAPVPREVTLEFARRLHDRLTELEMSQSDLAKKIWGTVPDKRGFEVARNRDRISQYVKGRSLPDRENAKKLAKALNCEVEDLVPERPGAADAAHPEVSMVAVAGRNDRVRLIVNKAMSLTLAAAIIDMLAKAGNE